jgi:hypothetical protein
MSRVRRAAGKPPNSPPRLWILRGAGADARLAYRRELLGVTTLSFVGFVIVGAATVMPFLANEAAEGTSVRTLGPEAGGTAAGATLWLKCGGTIEATLRTSGHPLAGK